MRTAFPRTGKAGDFLLRTLCLVCVLFYATMGLARVSVSTEAFAGDLYVATRWLNKDGLPQNSIISMAQTRDGYLWLGTFNGLVRFDGVHFTTFTIGNTPELRSDFINVLKVGADGALWIGTGGGGLVRYWAGKFERVTEAAGFAESDVLFLLNDAAGALWVGAADSVYRFDGHRFSLLVKLPPEMKPFSRMGFDKDGQLWLSTAVGFRPLVSASGDPIGAAADRGPGKVEGYCDAEMGWWRASDGRRVAGGELRGAPTRLMALQGENIWTLDFLNPRAGLELTRAGRVWNFKSNPYLNRHDITCFFADAHGNLWVGLDGGGLVRLRPKMLKTYSMVDGLPSENIVSLTEGADGTIWLARLGSKGGLSWVNPTSGQMTADLEPFRDHLISSCLRIRSGAVWMGTVGEGLYRWENGRFDHRLAGPDPYVKPDDSIIEALFEDRAGGLWVGTDRRGIMHFHDGLAKTYDAAGGLSHDKITAIAEDPAGAIWIGTASGLNQLSRDGQLKRYARRDGLGANAIHCLFVDQGGALWVGTAGGGLSVHVPTPTNAGEDGAYFVTLTTREGLLDDVVAQVIGDEAGNLWIGSNRGISRLDRRQLNDFLAGKTHFVQCVSFGADEGMVSEECGGGFQPACLKDSKGRLWFSTVGGPIMIDPPSVAAPTLPPVVHIEGATADGSSLSLDRGTGNEPVSLTVPEGTHTLEIQFSGIEFSAPEKVAFRYRMADFDAGWVDCGTRRSAFYTRLPPGHREFQVIARNNAGLWNETGAKILVWAKPSWWQTDLFRASVAVALLGSVAGAYFLQITRLKRRQAQQAEFSKKLIESQEQERKRIAFELHDSLGQTLSMIKNSAFRSLRALEQEKPMEAPLREIYDMSSQTVEEVRRIAQALRPYQIDRLGLATALRSLAEQTARSNEIEVEFESGKVDGLLSSEGEINVYRIVQEALNNAVKHAQASQVRVLLWVSNDAIELGIADNGLGMPATAKPGRGGAGGLGLQSIAERAQMLGAQFVVESPPGEGTRLLLRIPVRKSS